MQSSLNRVIVRQTIRREGKSQPPMPEYLAEARQTDAEIRARIKAGMFSQTELSRQLASTAKP